VVAAALLLLFFHPPRNPVELTPQPQTME
jgi:hypothetical protein